MRVVSEQTSNEILQKFHSTNWILVFFKITLVGGAETFLSSILEGWLWLTERVGWIFKVMNSTLSSIRFCSCNKSQLY